MQETTQLRQQATKLVGERIALAQEGNFAELLRRDELEANELRTRLAKPEEAEGADDEEEGAQEAAAAAVNLVQKESLTRAMKRLTSHGIASLGPEETKKVGTLLAQEAHPPLPSREWKERSKSKATELDFPTFTERIRDTARGGGADAFGIVYEQCCWQTTQRRRHWAGFPT